MSFSQIAKVYDRFNDLESYEQWLDFTLSSVEQQPSKVLDVACGTGWFTTLLSPFVETLIAIDIDDEMLDIARAEDVQSKVDYQKADMLDLSAFATDFDLVTCFADSLCFLESREQVATAIEQMVTRLKSGGTLLFDVWTPYQVTTGFDGFSYFDSDKEAAILWDSDTFADENKVEHYLTVFERDAQSGLYTRQETVLTERAYALAIYHEILASLPLASVEVLVDYGAAYYDEEKHQTVDRWFFRVVKR